jgi:hypothetical protein
MHAIHRFISGRSFGGFKTPAMRRYAHHTSSPRGQVVVIVAAGMVVIVALVGLVIDGGFAWGQQRKAQNGADAAAEAAAVVIAQSLKGAQVTDGDVGCAVEQTAAANGLANPTAIYTDWQGNFIVPQVSVGVCNPGGGNPIPLGAQGVKARGDRQFDTFLARVIGFNSFTTGATATAVAGVPTGICAADEGCQVLPVTFPLTAVSCDGQNQQLPIPGTQWPLVQVTNPSPGPTELPYASTANEAIIPLCAVGPGAVGWLDFGCAPNLSETITRPCNPEFDIPDWLLTQPGNTNSLDGDLNTFAGPLLGVPDDSQILIPINDNTCMSDPNSNELPHEDDPECPGDGDGSLNGSGNGNNFYYHISKWTNFMIDQVYTSGNNPPECNSLPGYPASGGNGATGCFKGWFVGPYVISGPVGGGATGPGDAGVIAIQLIR